MTYIEYINAPNPGSLIETVESLTEQYNWLRVRNGLFWRTKKRNILTQLVQARQMTGAALGEAGLFEQFDPEKLVAACGNEFDKVVFGVYYAEFHMDRQIIMAEEHLAPTLRVIGDVIKRKFHKLALDTAYSNAFERDVSSVRDLARRLETDTSLRSGLR